MNLYSPGQVQNKDFWNIWEIQGKYTSYKYFSFLDDISHFCETPADLYGSSLHASKYMFLSLMDAQEVDCLLNFSFALFFLSDRQASAYPSCLQSWEGETV